MTAPLDIPVFLLLLAWPVLVLGSIAAAELRRTARTQAAAAAARETQAAAQAAAFADQTAIDLAFTTITANYEEPTP